MKLINGWYFDFKAMLAFRKGNSYDKMGLVQIGTPPSILKTQITSRTLRGATNFFDDPEAHFNHNIDQAYHEFLLSECIEELLKSEPNNG